MKRWITALIVLALATTGFSAGAQQASFDIVIRNGTIVDGTGKAGYTGDIGIKDGAIVSIGTLSASSAQTVIDAAGLTVAPGFIDIHTHTGDIIKDPTAHNYICQGVTTVLDGNCGDSELDIAAHLRSVAAPGISLNYCTLIGQNAIRSKIMGSLDRAPTTSELDAMKALVEKGMRDGAVGMSNGLKYKPAVFASTEEVIELAKVAAKYGGIYTSHIRSEGNEVVASVREAIEVGEKAKIPVEISHLKVLSVEHWGEGAELLRLIDDARRRGIDVTADQYPYTASSTGLSVLIPAWALEGDGWKKKAENPAERQKIKDGIIDAIVHERAGNDLNRIAVANYPVDTSIEGLGLGDILDKKGRERTMDNAAELVLELCGKGSVSSIFHSASEEDVERIIKHPWVMHGSDGHVTIMGDGVPHPRCYGTFPRVLAVYVREKRILTLEEAIRKMTSLPAKRIGIPDRGELAEGKRADIVIFDPAAISDTATFQNPHRYPQGIDYVMVNGKIVVDHGTVTKERPGEVLFGFGKKK